MILNPVNILGAYDTTNWSRQLILPISKGALRVVPPGSATWVSVHDVVKAHIAAVDVEESGTNFVLGGVEASFLEVTNEIEEILGKPRSRRATSKATLRLLLLLSTAKALATRAEPELTLAKYQRAVGDLLVDDHKARQVLGLECRTLHDMLAETIEWLEQVGMLDQSESAQNTRISPGRPGSASDSLRGIDWVEVNDEPNHVEQFRNDAVRVYEARIDPGTATLYHHHSLDTIYVIMAGGRFRSEEPVHQAVEHQARTLRFAPHEARVGDSARTDRRHAADARRHVPDAVPPRTSPHPPSPRRHPRMPHQSGCSV